MRKSLRSALIIVALLSSCSDSSAPQRLTQDQRSGFDLNGIRIGMPKKEALRILDIETADYAEDPFTERHYTKNTETEDFDFDLDPSGQFVTQMRKVSRYPNGAEKKTLMDSLTRKFGYLAQSRRTINMPDGTQKIASPQEYFAGESLSQSGNLAQECFDSNDNLKLADGVPPQCGLTATIHVSGSSTKLLVDWVEVKVYDFSYKKILQDTANLAAIRALAEQEQQRMLNATKVEAF